MSFFELDNLFNSKIFFELNKVKKNSIDNIIHTSPVTNVLLSLGGYKYRGVENECKVYVKNDFEYHFRVIDQGLLRLGMYLPVLKK